MNQTNENNPDSPVSKPPQWLVLAAFAAVYIIWGSTYLGIRFAIQTMPPLFMAGTRYLAAGMVLYLILRLRGVPAPRPAHWKGALISGALFLLLQNAVLTWVEQKTPSALAALVVAATPFWMILLNRLLVRGTRLTVPLLGGLVLGFAGVAAIVLGKNSDGSVLVDPLHAGLLFAGSLCWAYGTIYSRYSRGPENTMLATAMQMIAGGALILVASMALGDAQSFRFSSVSRTSWIAFGYLAVFGSLVGYTAYIWLLKVSTIARVSTSAFVNPLVAVILGSTIAHETISPGIILGGVLIIGAVMLITWKNPAASRDKPATLQAAPSPGAVSGSVK